MKDGILIINKPKGITSHDVVDYTRNILKTRHIGHSGTLDPLASGVLIILIGRATKLFKKFLSFDKGYTATLTLGRITDTGDLYGKILQDIPTPLLNEEKVRDVLKDFIGEIQQIPPMVSAIRYKGKRLYHLARKGIEIPRQPRQIIIKELRLLKFVMPRITFYVRCSTGTYIRQLAADIAQKLGCGGHISEIERQSVGPYQLKDALRLEEINESHIRPWQSEIAKIS